MDWLKKLLETLKLGEHYVAIEEGIKKQGFLSKDEADALKKQVSTQKKTIKERDDQLETLSKKVGNNEELQSEIDKLKKENQSSTEKYEKELQSQSFNFALDTALRNSKVKNPKALKALLNIDNIKLDGETMIGLDDQLKTLKESDAYLFEDESSASTGSQGNHKRNPDTSNKDDEGSMGKRLASLNTETKTDAVKAATETYFG
jgi:dsDNA-binding SOS-regulon protein